MRCDTSAYGVLSQEKLRCVSWWNNCYKYWYDIHSKVYILKKNDSIWVSVCHTPVMSSSWGSRLPRTEGTLRVEWNGNLFGKNMCLLWLVCASGNWLKPLFLGHPVFVANDAGLLASFQWFLFVCLLSYPKRLAKDSANNSQGNED